MSRPSPAIPLLKFYWHAPADLLADVKAAAKRDGISVSRFITKTLRPAIYDRAKEE